MDEMVLWGSGQRNYDELEHRIKEDILLFILMGHTKEELLELIGNVKSTKGEKNELQTY